MLQHLWITISAQHTSGVGNDVTAIAAITSSSPPTIQCQGSRRNLYWPKTTNVGGIVIYFLTLGIRWNWISFNGNMYFEVQYFNFMHFDVLKVMTLNFAVWCVQSHDIEYSQPLNVLIFPFLDIFWRQQANHPYYEIPWCSMVRATANAVSYFIQSFYKPVKTHNKS